MVIGYKKDNDTEIWRCETGYWDSNFLLLLTKLPTAMLGFFLFKITFVNIFLENGNNYKIKSVESKLWNNYVFLYAYIIQIDIFIEGIQNIFKYITGVKGYLNIIDLWFQQYLEKEMFDQMHVPDTKTTRTKTIYDKTGASLDWIILDFSCNFLQI